MDPVITLIGLIIYVVFIFAGIGCAVISGMIEYSVVSEILPKYSFIIPLCIVLSFEVSKVFLIYFNEKSILLKTKTKEELSILILLRRGLVMVSAFCTLLFTFYNLYNPNHAELINKEIARETQGYLNIRQQFVANQSKEKGEMLEPYRAAISRVDSDLEREKNFRYSDGTYVGPRYKQILERRSESVENLNIAIKKISEQQNKDLAEFDKSHQLKIKTLEQEVLNNMAANAKYDNKIVAALLMTIWNQAEYPRSMYILISVIISLTISIGLEGVIYAAFKVFSMTPSDWLGNDIEIIQQNSFQLKFIRPIFAGMLFFCCWALLNVTTGNLLRPSLTLIIVMVFTGAFSIIISDKVSSSQSKKSKPNIFDKIKEKSIMTVTSTMTTAVLAFFAAMIIGATIPNVQNISSVFDFGIFVASGGITKIWTDLIS